VDEKKKVQAYFIPELNTYIIGSYETPTGGCDTVKTQDEICDRVFRYCQKGNVLFEGLLVSGLFSRYNALADKCLPYADTIVGFLSTPLEVCIARTLQRRKDKGNDKPFDPQKTLAPKFEAIKASKRKFLAAGKSGSCECKCGPVCHSAPKDVRDIPYEQAYETVLTWLGK
jgi:hypothetical protein